MTGKIQKAINDTEALREACSISLEERAEIIDEAICEIHAQNAEFLEAYKMPINSFRGMYQVFVLFQQVNELVADKCKAEVVKRAAKFQEDLEAKKRKKI